MAGGGLSGQGRKFRLPHSNFILSGQRKAQANSEVAHLGKGNMVKRVGFAEEKIFPQRSGGSAPGKEQACWYKEILWR